MGAETFYQTEKGKNAQEAFNNAKADAYWIHGHGGYSGSIAEKQGFTDSLMMDHEGNIAEATGANIFFKDKNNEFHTPVPDSFLDGITRRTVIEIAKSKNIKVHERKISPNELSTFVGCFLTGTAAEVTPVSKIAEYDYKVCETILELSSSYDKLVRKKKAA